MSLAAPFLVVALVLAAGMSGLIVAFVLIPIFKGLGWLIGGFFALLGALVAHVFGTVGAWFRDIFRGVGAVPAALVFAALSVLNVVIGRWSAAAHFGVNMQREFATLFGCVYRVAFSHPLRLIGLGGALDGLERRVPAAFAEAPGADHPGRRTGAFEGYTIVGSLPGGGSGGRLYIAEPNPARRARIEKAVGACPDRVVIKSFAIADGSSLPQIIRESRALECAKQLGLVLEHELTAERFHYVMPYVPGESLSAIVRHEHARAGDAGLDEAALRRILRYVGDVLETLHAYHDGGLWHKDVKPENIIIHDGRAHVVDLGLVTPLRSAMTLTTHGTEYFRDPELVRMALRGVKVHEVNGVKFDVYGAGAVLYHAIENTFPTHGGLSSITRRCPEVVKWIVRRAMTDYNRRYETAAMMLADVEAVLRHRNIFAMKPAELPSMSAGADELEGEAAEVAWAAHASSPRPERDQTDRHGSRRHPGRPRIHVVNWWTGRSRPVGPRPGDVPPWGPDWKQDLRQAVHSLRDSAKGLAGEVRAKAAGDGMRVGPMRIQFESTNRRGPAEAAQAARAARASAAEQVARAQARARALRERATVRSKRVHGRCNAPGECVSPSMVSAAIFLGGIVLVGAAIVANRDDGDTFAVVPTPAVLAGIEMHGAPDALAAAGSGPMVIHGPNGVVATVETSRTTSVDLDLRSRLGDQSWSYVLVNDHPASLNQNVRSRIGQATASLAQMEFQRLDTTDLEARIRSLITQYAGEARPGDPLPAPAEEAIEDLLANAEGDPGMVVWVYSDLTNPDAVKFRVIGSDDADPTIVRQIQALLSRN